MATLQSLEQTCKLSAHSTGTNITLLALSFAVDANMDTIFFFKKKKPQYPYLIKMNPALYLITLNITNYYKKKYISSTFKLNPFLCWNLKKKKRITSAIYFNVTFFFFLAIQISRNILFATLLSNSKPLTNWHTSRDKAHQLSQCYLMCHSSLSQTLIIMIMQFATIHIDMHIW